MPDLFLENPVDLKTAPTLEKDFLNVNLKAKEILGQINWVFTHRKVEYLSQILELRKHSSIQVRRKVAAGIGFLADKNDLETIQKWQLGEADRETWLILESTLDKLNRKQSGVNLEQTVRILSVTESLSIVKRLVGEQEYIIEGEVSEARAIKQMYSFSIKDNQDSRLDCWVYAGVVIQSGFPLNQGLSIRVTGKFKLSQRSSKIYFDVTKIQLSGEGELLRNLKMLEDKLRREGLFDDSRKRKLNKLPKNILLLASSSSAALTDFIKVLGQRRKGVHIYHLAIKTQGVGAESEVIENLELVNKINTKFNIDTVVVTRGGGSSDDLVVFNSEKVVRALHGINRPTVVAIGHERDTTLAEIVADLRASTPSQAAELVSFSTNEILTQLENYSLFYISYFKARSKQYQEASANIFKVIVSLIQRRIKENYLITEKTGNAITAIIGETKLEAQKIWQKSFMLVKMELNRISFTFETQRNFEVPVLRQILEYKEKVSQNYFTASRLVSDKFNVFKNQFELNSSQILLNNPENILKKGYAIIKQGQQVIEKVSQLNDSKITIIMQDGEVER